jgi:hypothetical protein
MYLTETSSPTRGCPTATYLETVLLHKSPLVSGCTVTACVSWVELSICIWSVVYVTADTIILNYQFFIIFIIMCT